MLFIPRDFYRVDPGCESKQVGATQTRLGVVHPQADVHQALLIYGCVNCVVTIVLEVGWTDEELNANAPLP